MSRRRDAMPSTTRLAGTPSDCSGSLSRSSTSPGWRAGRRPTICSLWMPASAARDGAQGLELGKQGPWDLILLDVMLPKMDGFDVCSELRKAGVRTPIIMLTARTQEAEKELVRHVRVISSYPGTSHQHAGFAVSAGGWRARACPPTSAGSR